MPVESPAETYILAGVTVLVIIASVWLFFWQRYKALLARRTADVERQHSEQLRAESERRAAAEGRLLRIPELEKALLVSESKLREHADEASRQRIRAAELEAALATERHVAATQGAQSEQARAAMAETFRALAHEALQGNAQAFATAANPMLQRHEASFAQGGQAMVESLRPVAELIGQLQSRLGEMERTRAGAYDALTAQVRELSEAQQQLRFEAANLAKAVGAPGQRGRWGEIQLRRAIELAGMRPHADFIEPAAGENGATSHPRPDVVVRLPGGRNLVVDAQAPVADYLDSLGALTHEERNANLHAHALALREHVSTLGSRAYWEQFQPAPEFVVLYLPGEAFFSAALDTDPALVEFGVEKRVLVATPTTLIALLRAVHYGWRQDAQVREARELTAIGADLHERLAQLGDRLAAAGRALGSTVEQYNDAMASFSSHILPAARILRDHLPSEAKPAADAPALSAPPLVERLAQPATPEELRPPLRPAVAVTNHAGGNTAPASLPAPPPAPVLNPSRPAGATGIRARVATPLRGVSPTIPPPPLG